MPSKSLRNVDLNLLVVFEAVFSIGNISHAATQLGMTQPAVSNALTRLRTLLNDPLFVRAKNGVEPTVKATRMIGPVREALGLIGGQIDPGELDLASYRRHFRVIMTDPLEPIMMPPIIRVISEKAPHVSIECMSGFRTNFVNEIAEGFIDLACYDFPNDRQELVTQPIAEVDMVVIARRGHPAFLKKMSAKAFLELGHVMLVPELRDRVRIDQSLASQNQKRRAVYLASKIWSIPPIVERTDLAGMVPRWFANEISSNFAIDIHEPPMKLMEQFLYMTWHPKNTNDPGHKWLRETLMSAFRDNVAKKGKVAAFGPKSAA